jgi:hypothetical protein
LQGVKGAVEGLGTKVDGTKDALGSKLDGIKGALDGIGDSLNGGGGNGNGDCKTSDCGEGEGGRPGGSGDGDGQCPYAGDDLRCSGADPWADMLPNNLEGPPTIEDAFQSFKDELSNGPLGPVITYQTGNETSGNCPTFTIPESRYWPAQQVDAHCLVYDQAAPIIYAVMTWAWAFIALYVLLF